MGRTKVIKKGENTHYRKRTNFRLHAFIEFTYMYPVPIKSTCSTVRSGGMGRGIKMFSHLTVFPS